MTIFAAALDGAVDDLADAGVHVGERFVDAVAVGAFGEQVIHIERDFGVAENVVVAAAKVAAEGQPDFARAFFDVEDDDARTENMAGIKPGCSHAVDDPHRLVVSDRHKLVERCAGVGLRV